MPVHREVKRAERVGPQGMRNSTGGVRVRREPRPEGSEQRNTRPELTAEGPKAAQGSCLDDSGRQSSAPLEAGAAAQRVRQLGWLTRIEGRRAEQPRTWERGGRRRVLLTRPTW